MDAEKNVIAMSDRFIKIIFLLFAAAVPFMDVAAQRFDIDVLFDIAWNREDMATIWEVTPADLPSEWFGGDFIWSSSGGREFHYSCLSSGADLRFLGMPVAEADFFLTSPGGRFQVVSMVICGPGLDFNREADPDLVRAHICRKLGTEWMFPTVIGESAYARLSSTEWVSASEAVTMFDITETASGRLLYLGIILSPAVEKAPWELLKGSTAVLQYSPEAKRVLLGIPSARQGDMNYCVPAAASRIARYYGSVADCQMIAALTGCRDSVGIELNKVDEVLNNITFFTGLECSMLYRNMDYISYPAIADFFERYNRTARSMGRERFPLRRVLEQSDEEISRCLTEGLSGMDRTVLSSMRRNEQDNMIRFKNIVKENIAMGKPLLWCVLADKQDDRIAFHLRIIHGYSKDGDEFIWSDSLEAAAVETAVNWEKAWDITAFLAVLEPASAYGMQPADVHTAF